jgi:outer membrane receptor protein involved in Fe transport
MVRYRFRVAAYATLCAAIRLTHAADDSLDEVIITASLAQSSAAALPASVSVLDAAALGGAGVAHFGDVMGAVPNVGFAGGTSRPRFFQIRGIGELEQYEGAPNPSVGFLIDDIDFSGIAMPAALFDLQQAEVLRGPQGSAYGANAIAGLISLRSQAPRDAFELRGELEAGNYGNRAAGAVINATTEDGSTAWRLGLHRTVGNGYRRNVYLQRNDTNGFDENLARLRVARRMTPHLQLNVTGLYDDADNGYDAWSIDNSRTTHSDRPGVDAQRSRAVAVRLDYDGWQGVALRSISTWADADMAYSFDGDWGNPDFWGANGPYDFFEQIGRRRRNATQELRLSGGRNDATHWVAGVYAAHMTERYTFLDLYNGEVSRELQSRYAATSLAAYGQVERDLHPQWRLSVGGRLERRAARYRDSNLLRSHPADTMAGGHVALTWNYATGQSLYAAVTRGYKAGGINTTAQEISADLRQFDPEFLWNGEVGWRVRSTNGRFEASTSLFYMRRVDQQVSSSVQSDPGNPLTFVLLTDNAARGENVGVEGELGWKLSTQWRLHVNASLLRAQFLDYSFAGRSLDHRDAPHAPRYQAGASVDWHADRGYFAQAEFQTVDGFYFSASHDQRAAAHQLVNLQGGFSSDRWTATLYVRNALNAHYAVRGFYFGNEPPDFPDKRYIQNGDPRQVGVRASFGF